jgi:hypothetical protein
MKIFSAIIIIYLLGLIPLDSPQVCSSLLKLKHGEVEKRGFVSNSTKVNFSMVTLPEKELYIIGQISQKYKLTQDQRLLLCAIRKHENGRPGREFGVLSKAAQKYADGYVSFIIQGEAAAQIILDSYSGDLVSFSNRYAPVGAENDPDNLNRFWYPIIKQLMEDWRQNTL